MTQTYSIATVRPPEWYETIGSSDRKRGDTPIRPKDPAVPRGGECCKAYPGLGNRSIFYPGSSLVSTITFGVVGRTPFCVVFQLSRVAQALSAWSWVFMRSSVCFFCISYIGILQSWPYASVAKFDAINLALAFPGPRFVQEPHLRRTYSISS